MPHYRSRIGLLLTSTAIILTSGVSHGQVSEPRRTPVDASSSRTRDTLEAGFRDPPITARPRVWWHWISGNITKDGIQKDLAWMRRTGIGGVQSFDVALPSPQLVTNTLIYMTPEWRDAFRFAVASADNLGLEFAIAASPGWSETGGPWVSPRDGMKKLVWSETTVAGGHPLQGALPSPPRSTGVFADVPKLHVLAVHPDKTPEAYEDVAVLAYPVATSRPLPNPRITSGPADLDTIALTDGLFSRTVDISRDTPGGPAEATIEYPAPQTIRSATVALKATGRSVSRPVDVLPVLEAETMKGVWRKVAQLPLLVDVPTTAAFPAITAARFRVRFLPVPLPTDAQRFNAAPGAITESIRSRQPPKIISVTELRLSSSERIDRFETKAGFSVAPDYYSVESAGPADEPGVPRSAILDLTSRLRPDGTLDWKPPAGRWKILRMGWSLVGTTNHPAIPEATGLEVDKLDRDAVERYMNTYLGMYRGAVGSDLIGKQGIRALLTDSIEVGAFNWTPSLPAKFLKLRGYDLTSWLPTLTGEIVGSRKQSERFLYDFRRTLGELVATEHYGVVAAAAHRNGLTYYGEALESGRPSLGDDMAMRSFADIPMAAYWTSRRDGLQRPAYLADMKGAASVAHVYGRDFVAAESFTSAYNYWAHAPADLKPFVDLEFAYGINRPVIHTSVHQPTDDKIPGLSLYVYGQYFNRHETWAEMARPWIDYISRSSFMLQQGQYVADVAYFYGEEAPLTGLYQSGGPTDAPQRYAFDFLNLDGLMSQVRVEGDRVVSRGGVSYRAIYLGGSSRKMTLTTLRRLKQLVLQGAVVIGRPPVSSPSLADDDQLFRALVGQLWSGAQTTSLGSGKVIASDDIEASLGQLGIIPDVEFRNAPASELLFLHRRLADGDIYFVTNRRPVAERVEARFRVTGRRPEIWHADTGRSEPVSYRIEGGQTIVPLDLAPNDAAFIVFRQHTEKVEERVSVGPTRVVGEADGPWRVQFEAGRGAPKEIVLKTLSSLTDQSDPRVRYFAGVATYRGTLQARNYRKGGPLWLDLGKVGDVAEVTINGREVGTAWKAPYRVDISAVARAGRNDIEIRVANLWVNRLVGDAQPGAEKVAFTAYPTYRPDAPLRPSGLIGPVTFVTPGAVTGN